MKPKVFKEEIPWPKKGDELFKPDIDWKNNACLNFSHDMSEIYISGYKSAGDILVEHVKQKKRNQDFLVYPIGFLYRQYLELRLIHKFEFFLILWYTMVGVMDDKLMSLA